LNFWSRFIFKNNIPDFVEIIDINFGDDSNNTHDDITNIPSNLKKIRISDKNKIKFIKKSPFGCIITDLNDTILLQN
jgi:hypothetical protein